MRKIGDDTWKVINAKPFACSSKKISIIYIFLDLKLNYTENIYICQVRILFKINLENKLVKYNQNNFLKNLS